MQRSNLQVMVRPRRLPEGAQRGSIKLDKYGNEIEMTNNMFQYDVVFEEEATQEEVYERLRTAVEKLVEGYCVGILAYGQTSSGKTYTVGTNGVEECYVKNPGIISRAASDIFRLAVPRDETTQINVKVTFMEIYNEQAFDLLHVDDKKKPVIKKVRDVPRKDRPGELVTDVEGLTTEEVASTQEVMNVLQRGSKNRRVAATTMNANSSRSHAVFTIFVEHLNDEGESTLASTPYLQLVDLAGSEVPEGDKLTMKEGVNINKSLSALGRVIIQLRDRSGHVSYRDSVLTRVLKPLLDGNSITTLIACISMESCNEAESKKTLHYAQQARKIEISAQKAQKAITREEFLKLKEENRRLKKLCASHNLDLGDLEMTIMELEEDKEKEPFANAARTEEMIQILLKYEMSTKTVEMLQEKCNQLQRLVATLSKETRTTSIAGEVSSPNRTFNLSGPEQIKENGNHTDNEAMEPEPRDELALVSALSVLDQDYNESASQLKYFIEMQKKSAQLEEKVLELERQLEASEAEKASTAKQMSGSKKSSAEFRELQSKLDSQTEKNRVLQEKLSQLRKDLKSSQVQNETIEKYKAKVESINRERVKLQRMLKEQGKKSQEEIKRQKREMIALQRQQQKAAAERSKLDMKQAAERKCQQRKLEQALAAKDRLEMLLKRKTENSKSAAKQQSVSSKSKMDSTNNNMSVYSKVKEMVDDEVNMAATRALSTFYVDDYTKQIQTFDSRLAEIEAQLETSDLTDNVRHELEDERIDLVEKRKNAQLVLDKNQEVQKSIESCGRLHERFNTSYDAQLTVKLLVSKCEKLAYQAAGYRDELATLKEQQQHTMQLLNDCEHEKQLIEEKYAAFIVETGRDEGDLEKIEQELKDKNAMIDELKNKLNTISHGMMIPRSPFTVAPLNPRRVPTNGRSVAVRRLDALRFDDYETSTLFSEDEKSFADNKETDPDWVANTSSERQRRANNCTMSHANTSGNSTTCITEPRIRKAVRSNSQEDNYEGDNENEEPPNKKKSEGASASGGCRCSGGKSCQKCKCTKAGSTCSSLCKCGAQCYNSPIQTDDVAQRIPAVISNMIESVENHKLY